MGEAGSPVLRLEWPPAVILAYGRRPDNPSII